MSERIRLYLTGEDKNITVVEATREEAQMLIDTVYLIRNSFGEEDGLLVDMNFGDKAYQFTDATAEVVSTLPQSEN